MEIRFMKVEKWSVGSSAALALGLIGPSVSMDF